MQITDVQLVPVELKLRVPYRSVQFAETDRIRVIFVQIETREGQRAWGCAAFDPVLTGETETAVMRACRACADRALDLNPLNIEFALAQLDPLTADSPAARCAFDVAFHDLLGLAAGLPLYRLFGGYRHRIQTSMTVPLADERETVAMAADYARRGFRILKIKGGLDPAGDAGRIRAVRSALPKLIVRLDVEHRYTLQQALDVARALEGAIEMLERPIPPTDRRQLQELTQLSPVPILVDTGADPATALDIAAHRAADGFSIRLATCGGLRCARQLDAIARSARLTTMIGCIREPALLIAAGLNLALSSPNVSYGDLDGHFDLDNDPSRPGFFFEEGWLVATDVPGLGCTVEL